MSIDAPHRSKSRRRMRRGATSLQVVLVLPVLCIVSFGVFEFSMLMVVQQTVTTAAVEGARAASCETNPVEANAMAINAVNKVLSVHHLSIDPASADKDSDTKMMVEFGLNEAIKTGDPDMDLVPVNSPAMGPGKVRVTVCLDLSSAPLLGSLRTLGFDLTGKQLTICSMMRRES